MSHTKRATRSALARSFSLFLVLSTTDTLQDSSANGDPTLCTKLCSCVLVLLQMSQYCLLCFTLLLLLIQWRTCNSTSIKSRPLAEYATEHWHGHAKFENVSSHIQDGIKSLFDNDKPHFAAWLWIFDEDNGQAMSTTKPAVPLYYAALLGFRDLAEYLLSENPESTPQGWFRYNSVTRISV